MAELAVIQMAAGISCGYCEHGTVHIEFRNVAGEVFAVASMGEAQAAHFLLLFTNCCEAITGGEPVEVAAAPTGMQH